MNEVPENWLKNNFTAMVSGEKNQVKNSRPLILIVPALFLGLMVFLIWILFLGTISIVNSSKLYSVNYNGNDKKIDLYKKALGWGLFGINRLQYWDENKRANVNTTVKHMEITMVDQPQNSGFQVLRKGDPVIASYSLSVQGTTGSLKIYFNYDVLKGLSPDLQKRVLNNEIYLALFSISHSSDKNYETLETDEMLKIKNNPNSYHYFQFEKI